MKVQRTLAGLWLGVSLLFALAALPEGAPRNECPAATPVSGPAAVAPKLAGLRVGIALGSGSMHGLAHVGVLQELEARGLEPTIVSGTSAGAIVGALYASGISGKDLEPMMRDVGWEDARRLVISSQGFYSNDPVRLRLEEIFSGRPIESWPRHFGAVATNVADGTRRLITTGNGALAVQASSAMPVAFIPVKVGGERLVDGALVEPNPVQAARDLGADFVIAVDVAYRPYEETTSGLTDLAFQSMHILINALGARQLREADVAIRVDVHKIYMQCGRTATIAAGREAVRRAWPEVLGALASRAERRAAR